MRAWTVFFRPGTCGRSFPAVETRVRAVNTLAAANEAARSLGIETSEDGLHEAAMVRVHRPGAKSGRWYLWHKGRAI